MEDLFSLLRAQPLFSELPDAELEQIVDRVVLVHKNAGEYLFHAGQEAEHVYLIVSGKVEVYAPGEAREEVQAVVQLGPGDMVGGAAVLEGGKYTVSVRALEPTTLIAVPAELFRHVAEAYPKSVKAQAQFEVTEELELPGDVSVEDLLPGEMPVVVTRAHWFKLFERLIRPVVLMGLVTVVAAGALFLFGGEWAGVVWMLWGGSLLLISAWIIWVVVDYFNDFYIVTTHRVIQINKIVFIREEREEAPIAKIQDVEFSISNALQRILNIGDLVISTAANQEVIEFKHVPNPKYVQEAIMAQVHRFKSSIHVRAMEEKRRRIREVLGLEPEPAVGPGVAPGPELEGLPPVPSESPSSLVERVLGVFRGGARRLKNYLNPFNLREERPNNVIVWRKHWIRLVGRIWGVMLFMGLLFIGAVLALFYVETSPSSPFAGLIVLVYVILFVLGLLWLLWEYEDWRNDLYILDDKGIIDEEKLPLGLNESRRQALFDSIQDVRYRIPGPLHALLNVGDVLVETAGIEGQFTFDSVKNPQEMVKEITRRLRALEERRMAEEQARIDESVLEILAIYHRELNARLPREEPYQGEEA